MSVLTPLRTMRQRTATPPNGIRTSTLAEWHVGLSHPGMFPEHEVGCPCAKAPCGLAIPRAGVLCGTHQGQVEYRQIHRADECTPRKWFQKARRSGRPTFSHRASSTDRVSSS
jgi:hypothetical protein